MYAPDTRLLSSLVASIALYLPDLRHLNLRYCYKISDKAVEAICDSLVKLESLNLSQCVKISDAAIARIASSLVLLQELRLWGCSRLTADAVSLTIRCLPALKLLDIRSPEVSKPVLGMSCGLSVLRKPNAVCIL